MGTLLDLGKVKNRRDALRKEHEATADEISDMQETHPLEKSKIQELKEKYRLQSREFDGLNSMEGTLKALAKAEKAANTKKGDAAVRDKRGEAVKGLRKSYLDAYGIDLLGG